MIGNVTSPNKTKNLKTKQTNKKNKQLLVKRSPAGCPLNIKGPNSIPVSQSGNGWTTEKQSWFLSSCEELTSA
jgi:hypothetical protein